MRRLASLSFAVLLATASVPALNGPAHAGLRLSPKIIEVLPDIANLLDAGIDITTNDVPGVVGSDRAPHTYAQQVAKVHFGHEFPKEPAIDAMIDAMLAAPTREDFVAAVRAYDRVLVSGAYVVPFFYLPQQWVAHWSRIERPQTTSLTGYALPTWWAKPGE